jgi:hypothetical protein
MAVEAVEPVSELEALRSLAAVVLQTEDFR